MNQSYESDQIESERDAGPILRITAQELSEMPDPKWGCFAGDFTTCRISILYRLLPISAISGDFRDRDPPG